jgi:hypothetical protein
MNDNMNEKQELISRLCYDLCQYNVKRGRQLIMKAAHTRREPEDIFKAEYWQRLHVPSFARGMQYITGIGDEPSAVLAADRKRMQEYNKTLSKSNADADKLNAERKQAAKDYMPSFISDKNKRGQSYHSRVFNTIGKRYSHIATHNALEYMQQAFDAGAPFVFTRKLANVIYDYVKNINSYSDKPALILNVNGETIEDEKLNDSYFIGGAERINWPRGKMKGNLAINSGDMYATDIHNLNTVADVRCFLQYMGGAVSIMERDSDITIGVSYDGDTNMIYIELANILPARLDNPICGSQTLEWAGRMAFIERAEEAFSLGGTNGRRYDMQQWRKACGLSDAIKEKTLHNDLMHNHMLSRWFMRTSCERMLRGDQRRILAGKVNGKFERLGEGYLTEPEICIALRMVGESVLKP